MLFVMVLTTAVQLGYHPLMLGGMRVPVSVIVSRRGRERGREGWREGGRAGVFGVRLLFCLFLFCSC